MSKLVFWENNEKTDGKYYGSIIPAGEVYDGVDLNNYTIRIWSDKPGNAEIILPGTIVFEGEEYNTVSEIDWHREEYLDSLVGSEGTDYSDTYLEATDCLAFDYYNNMFCNLADFVTVKCYDYLKNTNLTTVTADDNTTEYGFDVIDSYNLDYLENANSTNFEYGGTGEHAILRKVREGKQEYLLMHLWSQWQGCELDTGYLLAVEEVLAELENHPEIDDIREWLR